MIDPKRFELGVNVATGIVAVSVVVAVVQFVLRMSDAPSSEVVVAPARQSTPADLSAILRVAPFGTAAPATLAAGPAAPGLVLRGVIVARPQAASSAWIAAADGQAKAYRIGDDVGGGVILEGVARDHVTLRTGGRLDTLAFTKAVNRQGVANILAGIPASALGLPTPMPTPLPTPAPAPAPSAAAAPDVALPVTPPPPAAARP